MYFHSIAFKIYHIYKIFAQYICCGAWKITYTAILLDGGFLCFEQLVDLLPVITRRVQPIGKRGIGINREFDVRLVADLGNLRAICQHRQPGSAESGAEITFCRQVNGDARE